MQQANREGKRDAYANDWQKQVPVSDASFCRSPHLLVTRTEPPQGDTVKTTYDAAKLGKSKDLITDHKSLEEVANEEERARYLQRREGIYSKQ